MKTIILCLKRITLACLMSVAVNVVIAQEVKILHEVQRGETLESIAEHYGITVEMIKEANPKMGDFAFTGMKLNIPKKEEGLKDKNNMISEQNKNSSQIVETEMSIEREDYENQKGKWTYAMEIGFGFLDAGNEKGSSAFAYQATVGANYLFNNNIYAGARIGYNSFSASFMKSKSNIHMIVLPLEVGYVWGNGNVKLIPFTGFDLNIGLNGKTKLDGYDDLKMKVGGKLGVALNLGLKLSLWTFCIIGKYHLPVNEQQKFFFGDDAYPEVAIGYSF